jgi:hypothetical protein
MDEEGAVGLEHQKPHRLRETGREATRVENLAAGDEQAHGPRTVLSVSDRIRIRSRYESRCTRDPPTIASRPSGKRTQAFPPPS